ncbi:MAG: hypothetical protein JST93_01975 [Acidobacteria bacterium]|nr:hypothetical protein [Acidobacteriota bacterium]
MPFEDRETRLSLFGRAADELTRIDLNPRRFRAALRNHHRRAIQKEDGNFVFADLTPSVPNYEVELAGTEFLSRTLQLGWPGPGALEIAPPGEDELQVLITLVNGNRVEFATIPFLPSIATGSAVFGENGFSTTLAAAVEGVDVQEAELAAVAGLAPGQALRIVRSRRVLCRPGPNYAFPAGTTLAALQVVDSAGAGPLQGAQIRITHVNGAPLTTVNVGGVVLFQAALPAPPPPANTTPFLLGTDAARSIETNTRGNAVFYYQQATPITSLTANVSLASYASQSIAVSVQPGSRTFQIVSLVRS